MRFFILYMLFAFSLFGYKHDYTRSELKKLTAYYAEKNGVPISIFLRLIEKESQFDVNAVGYNRNGTYDGGIAQINSNSRNDIARWVNNSKSFDMFNPIEALDIASKYLVWLYNRYGCWEKAVMAYNCGMGNVSRETIPKRTYAYRDFVFNRNV